MTKRPLFAGLLLALLTTISFTSNVDDTDVIYWSDHGRLDWQDFQGDPRYDHEAVSAVTSSGIVHYRGCKNGQIIYKVRAYFEKDNSWVKDEALTEYHLAHEQLHFDITELAARRLRKALAENPFMCGEEEQFEQFITTYIDKWQIQQQEYDFGTRHSLDEKQQREWSYRVAFELSLLDEYSE